MKRILVLLFFISLKTSLCQYSKIENPYTLDINPENKNLSKEFILQDLIAENSNDSVRANNTSFYNLGLSNINELVKPELVVLTKIVDFGTVDLGKQKDSLVFLIKNISSIPIDITSTKILGPDTVQFEIISGAGAFTLLPDSSRVLQLRFKPIYVGRTTSVICFEYSGTNSPALVQLYAEGYMDIPFVYCTEDSAFVREKKNIQLLLSGIQISSFKNFAKKYRAKLRFQNTVIIPTDSTLIKAYSADSTIIEIQDTINESGLLTSIEFLACLGTVDYTKIEILDFAWLDSSGNDLNYLTQINNGHFRILDFTTANKNLLMLVWPNPSSDFIDIEYQITEFEKAKFYISNILGQNVHTIFEGQNLIFGRQKSIINLSQYPTGTYFLILQTPTERKSVRFVVNR